MKELLSKRESGGYLKEVLVQLWLFDIWVDGELKVRPWENNFIKISPRTAQKYFTPYSQCPFITTQIFITTIKIVVTF